MVLGRVTYEEFAAFWPRQSDDGPFATLNNTIKKLVVSERLRSAEWQNTSIIGDADMEELKAKGEGDFHITGSGTLVRNWIQRGLVDEVLLMVCSVLVGAGKRFFENGTTTTLKQVGIEQSRAGSLHSPTSRPHRDKSNRAVRRGPPAEESVAHDRGRGAGLAVTTEIQRSVVAVQSRGGRVVPS
jgi:dihydrofolate reductase